MSLLVDDTAPGWVFSSPDSSGLSMREAGWNQLANSPSASTVGYYNGTALWTTTPGATASFVFQGTEIRLYAAKSPLGGNMNITCDWNSSIISLNQSEAQPGLIVWQATGLDSGVLHAVRVQMVDKGRINIDSLGVTPGSDTAIPPKMPSPLPPAFRDIQSSIQPSVTDTIIMTETMTMTMTMTVSASSEPSQTISSSSLTSGALVGIVAGPIAFVLLIISCTFACWRKRRRRRNSLDAQQGSRFSGLRSFILGRQLKSQNSLSSGPSFIQITDHDEEKGEEGALEEEPGKSTGAISILPSIRRLSTLTLGASIFRTSPAPSNRPTPLIHPLPLRRPNSPLIGHRRNLSHAVTLSIDTNFRNERDTFVVGSIRTSKVGSFNRSDDIYSVNTGRITPDGFSTSDFTDNVREQGIEPEKDDADFYAEYHTEHSFIIRSRQDGLGEGLGEGQGSYNGRYTDEPDDIPPDTPLLLNSPAVASSNVSISHHSSALSHESRVSKGNKILRSLHSRSSKRSSLRQSLGKLSRRSSFVRTPITRTPANRKSSSTGTLDSPRTERGNRTPSTPCIMNAPAPAAETSSEQKSPFIPAVPKVPGSPTLRQPSTFDTNLVSPPRKVAQQLTRAHRPAGPRARSTSNASLTSQTSSSEGSSHSRQPSSNERGDMLSIVEEASGPGSMRTSLDNHDIRT